MKYEAWRISFQSSEAAARSAYAELTLRGQQLDIALKAFELQQAACSVYAVKTIGRSAIAQIRELDSAKLANKRPSLSR